MDVADVADDDEFVDLVARAYIARAFERELLAEAVAEGLAEAIGAMFKKRGR
ncbi:MAG: hypothetical protein V3W11_09870 [bacterium]